MAYLAMVGFIAVFAFGERWFGWSDPTGKVALALVGCYILGAISGYRARG